MTETTEPRKRGRPRKIIAAPADTFKLPRASLHELTTERLRTMIVRGQLEQGAVLVEADLCDMLDVSRTPLREAMKILAAQGLIELRANRSALIATMSREGIADLFAVMSNVEGQAASLAARRVGKADLATLHRLQDEIEAFGEAGNLEGYFRANQRIHCQIAAASGSATLNEVHDLLFPRTEWARYFALRSLRRWRESIGEHREILEALDLGQAERAGRLMAEHVLHTGQQVMEKLAEAGEEAA